MTIRDTLLPTPPYTRIRGCSHGYEAGNHPMFSGTVRVSKDRQAKCLAEKRMKCAGFPGVFGIRINSISGIATEESSSIRRITRASFSPIFQIKPIKRIQPHRIKPIKSIQSPHNRKRRLPRHASYSGVEPLERPKNPSTTLFSSDRGLTFAGLGGRVTVGAGSADRWKGDREWQAGQ